MRYQVFDPRLPLDQLLLARVLLVLRPYRGEFEPVDLIEKMDQLLAELHAEKFGELLVAGELLGRPGPVGCAEPVGERIAH
ncbi:MAG: hypothetical protein ACLQIB_26440 [Isosphaeraceae bacterium]